jgi:hypothetical protein
MIRFNCRREATSHPERRPTYIMALPKKEADTAEWQAAIEALMLVAESGGPTMFARIGVISALNRGYVREFDTSRQDT